MMVKHVKTPNKGGQNERHASAGVGMETCKSKISNGDAVKRRKLPDGLRAARIATQKDVIADLEVSKVCHQVAP